MATKDTVLPPPVPETPLTIAILGVGERGNVYASFTKHYAEWIKVVAVCDLDGSKCERFAKEYEIAPENIFVGDWTLMAERPKLADCVAICTLDRAHTEPAIAFAELRYNILLEKPMASTIEDCVKIYEAVMRNKVIFAVGHLYRYMKYTQVVKEVLDSNVLGEIMNIQHLEPIGFWHFAHSYVRGSWHKETDSSFSLLSKSCHDIDLLAYMMNKKCKRISSFGSLTHFKKEKKPKEAGNAINCLDCNYEYYCPYSAKKLYMDLFLRQKFMQWPLRVVLPPGPIDIESLEDKLRTGNYGRCVYEMDNDVCDQQVVNMEFENGATVSFSMIAFTEFSFERKTRIFGTRGQIEAGGSDHIKVFDFLTKQTSDIKISEQPDTSTLWIGKGSGSYELMQSFVFACVSGDQSYIKTGPKETLESHLYVFAAEHARKSGTVVDIEEFRVQHLPAFQGE